MTPHHPAPQPQAEDQPPGSPPQLARSGTARVSFREPISSSYSVEEEETEEGLQPEGDEDQHGEDEEEDDEEEGGFRGQLHVQNNVPPQMDLLGEERF